MKKTLFILLLLSPFCTSLKAMSPAAKQPAGAMFAAPKPRMFVYPIAKDSGDFFEKGLNYMTGEMTSEKAENLKALLHNNEKYHYTIGACDGLKGTLLHCAAKLGNKKAIELLLASGMNINVANGAGDTPLNIAYQHEHEDIIDLLRKHGGTYQHYPTGHNPRMEAHDIPQ